MTYRTYLTTILLIAIFSLAGCATPKFSAVTDSVDDSSSDSLSSNNLLYDNLVAQSDAVFLAQVSYISATKSDEATDEPYHQIAFSIEQAIVDDLELGSGIVMFVFGESPADGEKTAVHQLKVGDSIVVFAKEGINGTQTVIMPAAEATKSFLAVDAWEQVQEVASKGEEASMQVARGK